MCIVKSSQSRPRAATMKCTLCSMRPVMKCTLRDKRSTRDDQGTASRPRLFQCVRQTGSREQRILARADLDILIPTSNTKALARGEPLDVLALRGESQSAAPLFAGAHATIGDSLFHPAVVERRP